ncbi:MAG: cytochrome d ubiquinol oxidase subunit II [Phycisphaeraceae bacterium]
MDLIMFTHDTLAFIWFILLGVLLTGYAILDGFDLGVGILHLFAAKDDRERRIMMNSIGPLWDGNEVWLVTFGGAMFAAFPGVYSSVFPGFYNAFMLLLLALIFRAVSMEFRSKLHSTGWRNIWDVGFFLSSLVATLLFGVAAGNALIGVRLDGHGDFTAGLLSQLNPYAVLVGLFTIAMFAMHGALYLYLKTEGDLRERIRHWMWRMFGIFLVFYMLTTMYTLVKIPRATANFDQMPWAMLIVVLNVLAIANIPRCIYWGKPGQAFLSSCFSIAAFVFLFSIAMFPNLVTCSNNPGLSLTIGDDDVRSSATTLRIMLLIAVLGLPCVLTYTAVIYWTFRGKVTMDAHSY